MPDLCDSERKPLNRVHARGEAFAEGEYYVCAEIWVKNPEGKFLVTKDVDITDIVLQPGETVDAKWATADEIQQMIENEEFVHSVGIRFKMYRELVV